MIRQPIVVLVGHIDHGKSSILEKIRGISITKAEPGGITQTIKSYNVALSTIKNICGSLLERLNIKLTIPGLLFLDSPGHAAFNNLRKRGGNLADIAILVIDIREGLMEQTLECIDILKQYKTPFIIALNKIDLISGYRSNPETSLILNLDKQSEHIQENLNKKLYEIVGKLSELGFNADRFDKIDDYTKQIAMLPISAKTGEGIPELLMILTGLAQKYLEKKLKIEIKGPGKATVLEVKEEKGIGLTLDIVLYDGKLKQNDTIVIAGLDSPIITKVKALLEPDSDTKKLKHVNEIGAAAGVKIIAPDIKNVIAGMPLRVANENIEQIKQEIQKEIQEVLIQTDREGIIVKADSLGSLEALVSLLKERNIEIKKAHIGDIAKQDILEAKSEKDELNKVILGFNVKLEKELHTDVKIITNDVIYKIIEDFENWKKEKTKEIQQEKLKSITKPFKIQIIKGCIFRQSKPCVVGVIVLNGTLRKSNIMKEDGTSISQIKSMQVENKSVDLAEKGKEVAISIPNITAGRQIKEEDILISDITENEFKKLKELKDSLTSDEILVLKEIAKIKRKEISTWGM